MSINIKILNSFAFLALFSLSTYAEMEMNTVETVTIVGSQEDVAGSATVLSNEDLAKMVDTDIHKILSAVPGVYVRTEDGYGLRPNISIRGTAPDRSGKVTLMEDGVLIAPAPYTSASAYYFPTTGRIHAVEVLKGPAAITQGPSTIGGAINMISTPIPDTTGGSITSEMGSDGLSRTHMTFGLNSGKLSGLLEVHNHSADGFDSIMNVGGNTGFDKSDTLAKLRYTSGAHQLTVKMLEVDETSNQTYVGLSQASFDMSPRKRYGMSKYDVMNNDGDQTSFAYVGDFEAFTVRATMWSNDYHRDWFKVDKANNTKAHGVEDGIDEVIAAANAGDANAQAILDGDLAVTVKLKHNNRFYTNEGMQFDVSKQIGMHDLTFGYRDMEDSESRLQSYECTDQTAGGALSALVSCSTGFTGSNNRLRTTTATSWFMQDTITMGALAVTVGHRSEEFDKVELRWDDGVPTRTMLNSSYPKSSSGDYSTTGVGATYGMNENLKLVAGFHQGMSPVFGGDAEQADNMELGFRYNKDVTALEVMYFASDYANLVGECKNSSGGDCEAGDTFSGGEVDVSGLEVSASTIIEGSDNISYPMALTWATVSSEFQSSFDSDYFGTVAAGDDVPYLPESQLAAVVGFVTDQGLSGDVRIAKYGSTCSTAQCGAFENIEAYTFIDLSLRQKVSEKMTIYTVIENITDDADIVARAPKNGARSQKPKSMKFGFTFNF
ncbi:TonB-dependent receptor [Gammaproteobacteria bacterium]|nr:TonB-dependent receptor [Gammaproteobacteria bacterium]